MRECVGADVTRRVIDVEEPANSSEIQDAVHSRTGSVPAVTLLSLRPKGSMCDSAPCTTTSHSRPLFKPDATKAGKPIDCGR